MARPEHFKRTSNRFFAAFRFANLEEGYRENFCENSKRLKPANENARDIAQAFCIFVTQCWPISSPM